MRESKLSESEVRTFERDGYLVVEGYLSAEQAEDLKREIHRIIDEHDFTDFNHTFTCADNRVTEKVFHDEYFLTSWDKICFFLEKDANKDLNVPITNQNKIINKVGHNLHNLSEPFKKVSYNQSVKTICQQLGFDMPAICQSMYIFKSAKYGSVVMPHQDATFLLTEPECRILGFWIALEDVTLENGCLWAVPGSHKNGLLNDVRFVRDESIGPYGTKLTASYPEFLHESYTPLIVSKGSLILLHGNVVHKSLSNTSDKPRDIYTWHIVDVHNTIWHKSNWMQPPNGISDFTLI